MHITGKDFERREPNPRVFWDGTNCVKQWGGGHHVLGPLLDFKVRGGYRISFLTNQQLLIKGSKNLQEPLDGERGCTLLGSAPEMGGGDGDTLLQLAYAKITWDS